MASDYIPLTQTSPSEYRHTLRSVYHGASLSGHVSRRRAVFVFIAISSLFTFVTLSKLFGSHEDDLDLDDLSSLGPPPSYIAVPVPDALPDAARPRLRSVRELPAECLEQYYASGLSCHDGKGLQPMDVLWTWVNGSDPLFFDAKAHAINSFDGNDPYRPVTNNNPYRMFRDNDELRHSMRSVLDNFRPYTKRFHLLTSDFDYPEEIEDANSSTPLEPGYWRLGLQPQWLQSSGIQRNEWRDGSVQLSLTHHARFFEPYNQSIFNSYAIESQFSHLQELSEVFIYMNDDFFMVSPLTPVTFYTQPYGLVLRMQQDLGVSPDWPSFKTKGEWRSMGVSNFLLSERFGRRKRPYVQHEAKSASLPLLQEMELIWPDWVRKTATHAFRETVAGDGDFYTMFIHVHFVVERAREALLWSWVVGRVGAVDDGWGPLEAQRAWIELGGTWEGEGSQEVKVESPKRDTLNPDRVAQTLKEGGVEGRVRTEYQFSSQDGYPYMEFGKQGAGGWPGFSRDVELDDGDAKTKRRPAYRPPTCTIKREECFGLRGADGGAPKASEIFKEIAFNKPQCGDCVMMALLNASGRLGLSAFLPSPDRLSPRSYVQAPDESQTIPHLPLVANWHDGAFALRDVMQYASETNVRQWTMRLLQRYRYVIGGTASMFEQLKTLAQVKGMLAKVDKNQDLSLLCINDDATRDEDAIARYFSTWQDKKWSRPAEWEVRP